MDETFEQSMRRNIAVEAQQVHAVRQQAARFHSYLNQIIDLNTAFGMEPYGPANLQLQVSLAEMRGILGALEFVVGIQPAPVIPDIETYMAELKARLAEYKAACDELDEECAACPDRADCFPITVKH